MCRHALSVFVISLAFAASNAWADDKSECTAGLQLIKAAIAKKPANPVLNRLQEALKTAEQEVDEGDWDECVAAIRQGKQALQQKQVP